MNTIDDNKIRILFPEIQLIIDEVETRLDNLIIFGEDDSAKPKISALRRASIHAAKVLAKAKTLFPKSKLRISKGAMKIESTKSLEDEIDDLIDISAAVGVSNEDTIDFNTDTIPPPGNSESHTTGNKSLTEKINVYGRRWLFMLICRNKTLHL